MKQESSFQCVLVNFSEMFTCPSLWTFITLACGFVLCTGRRTISRVIQIGCFAEGKRHHSIFYRFFSTDAEMGVQELAQSFSLRWTQEEMHRNVKQYLGLEDPQNGWWRRPKGRRRNKKIPGPQPHKKRGEKAGTRTVPFILTIYALVVLWYFGNGSAREDVERARRLSPWYREKTEPSGSDMLAALRRQLWAERNFSAPSYEQGSSKIDVSLLDWLCAA